jgi:hypothetical protein
VPNRLTIFWCDRPRSFYSSGEELLEWYLGLLQEKCAERIKDPLREQVEADPVVQATKAYAASYAASAASQAV